MNIVITSLNECDAFEHAMRFFVCLFLLLIPVVRFMKFGGNKFQPNIQRYFITFMVTKQHLENVFIQFRGVLRMNRNKSNHLPRSKLCIP